MKKLALLLALALALSCCLLMLASCNEDEGDTSSTAATSSSGTSSAAASSAASSKAEESSAPAESSEPEEESSEPEPEPEPEWNPDANENPDGENLALGKSYEKSQLYQQGGADKNWGWDDDVDPTYPDTDDIELTDGILAEYDEELSSQFYHDAWMGFAAGCPDYTTNGYSYVTVNLEDSFKISEIVLYVGTSALGGGIGVPGGVEFLVSEDGENFVSVGKVTPVDDPDNVAVAVTLECEVTGQYVQARITGGGWMFVCELEVR